MHVPDDYNVDEIDDLVTAYEMDVDDMDDMEEDDDMENPLSKEECSYQGCTRGEMNVFVGNEEGDLCNFFHKHVYTIEMSLVDEERRASLRCLIEATHTGILFRVASNHEMRDVIIAFAKRAYPADKFSVVDLSLEDEHRFSQQYDSCLHPFQETKEGMNLHLSTFDELLLKCLMSSDHVYDDEDEEDEDESQLDDDGMSLSMEDWLDMDLPDENEIEDPDYQAPCVQENEAIEVIEISDDDDDDNVVEVEMCERESFIEILSRYF